MGRKHLLAADHPIIAVSRGAGPNGGDVGTGIGFGVAEHDDDPSCRRRRRTRSFWADVPQSLIVLATNIVTLEPEIGASA
jgi:hypothetical protein